jgi:D-alanyl-lipoteichoic acid acyltransferase DltB (MBOAT superfamily)
VNVAELLVGVGLYIALGRGIVRLEPGAARDISFAALNLAAVYLLFFPFGYVTLAAVFVAYVMLAVAQYLVLRAGGGTLAAFGAPIAALIAIKAVPAVVDPDFALPGDQPLLPLLSALIGISYFAFRTSYLALEVRNGQVAMPTLGRYLGFCFFAPTMAVGPINRYATFKQSLDGPRGVATPLAARAALRLLVGAVKYRFLAGILDQLTYTGLLLDGHPHHWVDLGVAAVAYYLYLYCNFSGFCDMAIGAAGLIGIGVEENFRNPFAARNVRDFWNRWHITLSIYMRDVVFTPASKYLTGALGAGAANHAAAISIVAVFVLIGLWHGPGWNFVAFGAMHALGVVVTHYYTLWLKRRLGRDRFSTYNNDPWIRAAAVATTFVFVTATFFLFANSFADMGRILATLRWS